MPQYEYECNKCGDVFEINQNMHDNILKDCPKCGEKNSLIKLISHSNFKLKGGGWFSQGYQKKK